MAREASKLPRLLLYKRDASPPSCAVMMLGDILGLKFDYKEPDLINLEHKSPEFKKINPIGTIPVLQDGDFILSESHAIMKYLLGKYGGEQQETLYPSEVHKRAAIDQRLFYDSGVMFNRLKVVAVPTLLKGLKGPTPDHIADIEDSYSVLEAFLQKTQYIASDNFTLADLSLGTTTTGMQAIHKLDANKYPRTADWMALLSNKEFFKTINEPGVALFTKLLNAFWKRNNKNKQ